MSRGVIYKNITNNNELTQRSTTKTQKYLGFHGFFVFTDIRVTILRGQRFQKIPNKSIARQFSHLQFPQNTFYQSGFNCFRFIKLERFSIRNEVIMGVYVDLRLPIIYR